MLKAWKDGRLPRKKESIAQEAGRGAWNTENGHSIWVCPTDTEELHKIWVSSRSQGPLRAVLVGLE